MLKLTTTVDSPERLAVRIEGRLVSDWISELESAVGAGSPRRRVELDVAGLTFADTQGIAALRRLADQGLSITNCSPFIAELMRENRR